MAMKEEMSVFFDTSDFADTVIVTPKGQPHPSSKSVEMKVIAEQRYPEGTKIDGFVWTILGEKELFDCLGISAGATVRIPDGKDRILVEREPVESDDVVTMWVLQ